MDLFKIFQSKSKKAGFSIPELLVSIAIITIVTSILLFRFSIFNNTTLLNSQAYEIALDIRQAQVAGISVRGDGPTLFEEEYGMYFDLADDKQYIFFRDSGDINPARYDAGEGIDVMLLDNRFHISSICVNDVNPDCSTGTNVSNLAISFKRPNFDAIFYSSDIPSTPINSALIVLEPADGSAQRAVSVSVTGQISVE